jgi:hypothetical protein
MAARTQEAEDEEPQTGSQAEEASQEDPDEEVAAAQRAVRRAAEEKRRKELLDQLRKLKRQNPTIAFSDVDPLGDEMELLDAEALERMLDNALADPNAQRLSSAEETVLQLIATGAQYVGDIDITQSLLGDRELHQDLRAMTGNFLQTHTPASISFTLRIASHIYAEVKRKYAARPSRTIQAAPPRVPQPGLAPVPPGGDGTHT